MNAIVDTAGSAADAPAPVNHEAERYRAFVALLARLAAERGLAMLTADGIAAHARGRGRLALLFTGDPTRTPESWDVAVVLPELLRTCGGFEGATLDPVHSRVASARFGVDRYPSLVVLRDGEYVGVIEGMRDWLPFRAELARLGESPATAPPPLRVPTAPEPPARSA